MATYHGYGTFPSLNRAAHFRALQLDENGFEEDGSYVSIEQRTSARCNATGRKCRVSEAVVSQ